MCSFLNMAGEQFCDQLNQMSLIFDDILGVQKLCIDLIRFDDFCKLRNDTKLRAIISSKTYKDFANIINTVHLKPLRSNYRNESDSEK